MTSRCSRRAIAVLAWLMFAATAVFADDPKPPETHTVTPGPFQLMVDLDGHFEAEQTTEVVLRPEVVLSLVVEKAVPQGTKVAAGEPIVWLETEKLDRQLKTSEFELEQS